MHRDVQAHESPALSLHGPVDAIVEHIREQSAQVYIADGHSGGDVGMHLKGNSLLACATRL